MSETHPSVDEATLREVQRALSRTDYASIEDLAARSGFSQIAELTHEHGSTKAELPLAPGADPLPKRRSA